MLGSIYGWWACSIASLSNWIPNGIFLLVLLKIYQFRYQGNNINNKIRITMRITIIIIMTIIIKKKE